MSVESSANGLALCMRSRLRMSVLTGALLLSQRLYRINPSSATQWDQSSGGDDG